MPEIIPLGWAHTIVGIVAVLVGFYTLAKYRLIEWQQVTGKIYLLCSLFVAVTAMMIFQHGGFGIAHVLAILTLLALAAGAITEKTQLLGKLSPYFQALCYSATLLFHMLPAITDSLMRLPVGDPVLTNIEDPLLKKFYLAFLIVFVVGYIAQVFMLRARERLATQN